MSEPAALVTGGAGFIGSGLVRGLLQAGHRVRVIDDLSTGYAGNLEEVASDIEMIEGSILDPGALAAAVADVGVIYHQAAIPSVGRSVEDPMRSHEADATGTLAVLIAAKDAGVERVVYAASSSAYGGAATLPAPEGLPALPVSPYAVAKLTGEHYCRAFTSSFGLPTISLRYFNVFGPRQDPSSDYAAVIPRFARAMLRGEQPVIYGDGLQSRDFTYLDNVVQGNLAAARAGPEAFGRMFNVAQGGRISLLELVDLLAGIVGVEDVRPTFEAERPGDVKHSQADVSAAREVLGYEPQVSFEEGLRRTVEWIAASEV
jgi:UDP-N-acetylglucosamine/UDP-N-acetyl-alpha-D-glucosaminouronate 4-epimerase